MVLNLLLSFVAFMRTFYALQSTLLAQANTCSLVISLVCSLLLYNFCHHIIVIIYAINKLFFKSSFYFIFAFICLHSLAAHPFISILTLFTLVCNIVKIIMSHAMAHIFHSAFQTAPTLVLDFSCSSSFNVCMNCSPSLPSQLNVIGTFLISCLL